MLPLGVEQCLPVLVRQVDSHSALSVGSGVLTSPNVWCLCRAQEAAVSEAAEAAGVRISPRHAEKTVGGMPAVGGKAAVQWQEWLRKEKGLKLELTPIATSGLAWQRGGQGADAAMSYASMTAVGHHTGQKRATGRGPAVAHGDSPQGLDGVDAPGARPWQEADADLQGVMDGHDVGVSAW